MFNGVPGRVEDLFLSARLAMHMDIAPICLMTPIKCNFVFSIHWRLSPQCSNADTSFTPMPSSIIIRVIIILRQQGPIPPCGQIVLQAPVTLRIHVAFDIISARFSLLSHSRLKTYHHRRPDSAPRAARPDYAVQPTRPKPTRS